MGKNTWAKLYSQAGTGYMYVLKRKKAGPKFVLRKYDPIVKAHVLFTETKPKVPRELVIEVVKQRIHEIFAKVDAAKELQQPAQLTIKNPLPLTFEKPSNVQ